MSDKSVLVGGKYKLKEGNMYCEVLNADWTHKLIGVQMVDFGTIYIEYKWDDFLALWELQEKGERE